MAWLSTISVSIMNKDGRKRKIATGKRASSRGNTLASWRRTGTITTYNVMALSEQRDYSYKEPRIICEMRWWSAPPQQNTRRIDEVQTSV